MIQNAMSPGSLPEGETPHRFEARSVTGAGYTLVEERCVDGADGSSVERRYRPASAALPGVANDNGSFTIVDTHTRLVRVGSR